MFDTHNLFLSAQHGLTTNKYTITVQLQLNETILQALEDRNSVAIALCDLSKASDYLLHDVLLGSLIVMELEEQLFTRYVNLSTRQNIGCLLVSINSAS